MRRIPVKLVVLVGLVCVVAIALIVSRVYFVWFVRVPTGNMMNTILIGDHLVVGRALGQIERGDVVVFWYPGDSARYMSRIIGLPGETIELRNRDVYINGLKLPEQKIIAVENASQYGEPLEVASGEGDGPYRVYYTRPEELDDDPTTSAVGSPFRIAEGHYFLMGDNRDNSQDSRYRGVVPRALIWGKVSIVYWSVFEDRQFEEHIRWDRIFTRIR